MIDPPESIHYFFMVDRSGSMSYLNRMKVAKEAMEYFVMSLPIGCKFSILSFGSNFSFMEYPPGN